MSDRIKRILAEVTALRKRLDDEYPNHCKTCRGLGGRFYFYSGSLDDPPEDGFDYCGQCMNQGRSPLDTNQEVTAVEEGEGIPEDLLVCPIMQCSPEHVCDKEWSDKNPMPLPFQLQEKEHEYSAEIEYAALSEENICAEEQASIIFQSIPKYGSNR